jgi:hypothetical protein
MTNEEINLAIAEFCGWKLTEGGRAVEMKKDCRGNYEREPSYIKDLNAVYDAERLLLNHQRRKYAEMLVEVHPLNYDPTKSCDDCYMRLFMIANMTARQRCEALLKTIGKWKD